MGEIFCSAYLKTASVDRAVKTFSCTGIVPRNPSVFREEDLSPASVIARELIMPSEESGLANEAGPSNVGHTCNNQSPTNIRDGNKVGNENTVDFPANESHLLNVCIFYNLTRNNNFENLTTVKNIIFRKPQICPEKKI